MILANVCTRYCAVVWGSELSVVGDAVCVGDIFHFVIAGTPSIPHLASRYFIHRLLSVYCTT